MMTYSRKLPKHVKLSDHLNQQADGYLHVLCYGKGYYIPLTKEMKKLFVISRRGNGLIFNKKEYQFDDIVRVIIDSVYLQIRDTIGGEIQESLMTEIKHRIDDVIAPQIGKEIDKKFDQKLLGEKENFNNTKLS